MDDQGLLASYFIQDYSEVTTIIIIMIMIIIIININIYINIYVGSV